MDTHDLIDGKITSSIEDRVYLERVRLFFGHAVGNMASAMVGAVLIAAVLKSGNVATNKILYWLATIFSFSLVVAYIERLFTKSTLTIENARKWVWARIVSGSAIGIMYGISPFFFHGEDMIIPGMFIMIILSTMVSVAITGYSTMPFYFLSLNCVIMIPLTIYFFSKSGEFHHILVTTSIIWQIIVLTKGWKVSKTAIGAIIVNERLRDEVELHMKTKEQLKHMATHDALTDLPNRRLLHELVSVILNRASRYKKQFAIMFIDLDGFKSINDSHGHDAGDALLQEIANRLKAQTRSTDIIARMGGDEFVIVYSDIEQGVSETNLLAKRILKTLNNPIHLPEGGIAHIGGSIGISLYPKHGSEIESLIKAADDAMYVVKEKEKNNFIYASDP